MKYAHLLCSLVGSLALMGPQATAEETSSAVLGEVAETMGTLQTLFATPLPTSFRSELLTATARTFDVGAFHADDVALRTMEEARDGSARSVGIIPELSERGVIVREIAPESGAAKAGIKPGALLVRINGKNVSTLSFTEVCFALEKADADSVSLVLEDEKRTASKADVATTSLRLPAVARREILPEDFAYLRLNGVYADSGLTIAEHLRASSHKPGLILDLRDAGGSDSESVREIASLLAPKDAALFAFYDAKGDLRAPERSISDVEINTPVMVLINAGTTGASELLAATLSRSTRGAMLVGTPTAGDPLLRSSVPVSGGGALWIATRLVRFADGSVIKANTGLQPDIVVSESSETPSPPFEFTSSQPQEGKEQTTKTRLFRRVANDAPLQHAVDILQGLKALNVRSIGLRTPAP